jgi:response regulator NasT
MSTTITNKAKPQGEMSVLLVEEYLDSRTDIKQTLFNLNYQIDRYISSSNNLLEECRQSNPDILIIKTQIVTSRTLKELSKIKQSAPLPILIITKRASRSQIKKTIQTGANTYVEDEVEVQRLEGMITVTCERFKEIQSLHYELEHTKAELKICKLVEQAKYFIMQQKKMSEQQAYKMLDKMSLKNGQPLATVCKNVIEVCELLRSSQIKNHNDFSVNS